MKITLAYSPDTDDAFMVRALRERLIDAGPYQFEFISEDIQVLNEAAKSARYDISAISMAAYPGIWSDYWLMPIGASVGDEFGPAVVVRPEHGERKITDLQGLKIAIPGYQTSAYLAALSVIGPFTAVPMRFDKIATAVSSGAVDAGILIHELQIDCSAVGLTKIGDLGSAWNHKFDLPLPLGGIVIRRALGIDHVKGLHQLYKQSIEYALNHRQISLRIAVDQAKTTLDHQLADRYIDMYVNHRSLALQDDVRAALDRLFATGAAYGLAAPLTVADHICP